MLHILPGVLGADIASVSTPFCLACCLYQSVYHPHKMRCILSIFPSFGLTLTLFDVSQCILLIYHIISSLSYDILSFYSSYVKYGFGSRNLSATGDVPPKLVSRTDKRWRSRIDPGKYYNLCIG